MKTYAGVGCSLIDSSTLHYIAVGSKFHRLVCFIAGRITMVHSVLESGEEPKQV